MLETDRWRLFERQGVYRALRPAMTRLIDQLDAMEVPVVWAVVGAMIDSPRSGEFVHLPVGVRTMIQKFLRDARRETRNASDILDRILAARTQHEIASHTYSHTRFDMTAYGEQAKRTDLLKGLDAVEQRAGMRPCALVLPQNIINSLNVIEGVGIRRVRVPSKAEDRTKSFRATALLRERVFAPPPAVCEEAGRGSLLRHSTSLFFNWPQGGSSSVRRRLVLRQAYRGLKRSNKHGGGSTHVWLHPFNLVSTSGLENDLLKFLRRAVDLRDYGNLEIRVMSANQGAT